MSLLRYALPALAAVGSASASCSVSGTTTIQNSGDAQAFTTCSTFTGSIAIATGTTDNIMINGTTDNIMINGPQRIEDGGISCKNAPNITTIGSTTLETIDDTFELDTVQILSSLSFGSLTEVGAISWNALANLANLDMAQEIQDTDSLSIQNTILQSLNGINLKRCNSFTLANNGQLQNVSLQLQNVTGAISFEGNGDRLAVDFPNLESAQNITFRNVNSVSMPSLATVNGSLGFIENDGITSVSCPNLTSVQQSLSINTNSGLNKIDFPELQKVGGAVNVQNNTELKSITFPQLTTISGAFDAYGNFTNVTLPKINDVRGAFNVQSSEELDCSTFDSEHGMNSAIKGKYQCAGKESNPGDASTTASSGSSSSSGSGKTGAANHLDMPSSALTGVLGVLAAMLGML